MAQAVAAPRRERDPNHKVEIEPSPRWVRVVFNGQTIADSKQAKLLRETGLLPVYYFPKQDVRMDLMEATTQHTQCQYKGEASYWTIRVGDKVSENSVWSYLDPLPGSEMIGEHLAFYWRRMDLWYEEEEQIYAHPRDPYHRVDVIESSRNVRVAINGETVAETSRPRLLFETGMPTRYYLPPEDVCKDLLTATATHTRCPYKGEASYWTAKVGDTELTDIVWGYLDPIAECPRIKGYFSFFNEKVDIYVDGELQQRPRTNWS